MGDAAGGRKGATAGSSTVEGGWVGGGGEEGRGRAAALREAR